jgi:glucose/arabinose dehydrogenase
MDLRARRSTLFLTLLLGLGASSQPGCQSGNSTKGTNGGNAAGEVGNSSGGNNTGGDSAGQGGNAGGGVAQTGGAGSKVGGSGGSGTKTGGTAQTGGAGQTTGPVDANNKGECVPPGLKLTRVTTTASPMALTGAPGDERIFVVERDGRVRILSAGKLLDPAFLDIRSSVITTPISGGSERGLLNIALHPKFPSDPRFYLFYTRRSTDPHSTGGEGHIVIAEGRQSAADPNKADAKLTALSVIAHREDHHIGGMLDFGPEGYLYAGIGDGGGMDSEKAGQDPTRKLSKILRIDIDKPDTKPAGNLSLAGADRHAWAYGIRNPYRGSFDRKTGDMYIGDVGWSSWEEINWVPPGKTDLNFGWGYDPNKREGTLHYQAGMEGTHPMPAFTHFAWEPFGYLPIHEYPHDGAGSAVIKDSYMQKESSCEGSITGPCAAAIMGGIVYRGSEAKLDGRYFYGDNVRNFVKSFIVKDGKATCHADHTSELSTAQTRIQGLNGFGRGGDGTLYLHDLAAGNIFRIDLK